MRIDSQLGVAALAAVRPAGARTSVDGAAPADRADFSRFSAEFQVALQALQETPDVREDEVLALRAQVESGTFAVDADALAEKLLGKRNPE